jgi:hypothetical protein
MTRHILVLAVLAIALIGMAGAANYMYEKASVKGVGYKNVTSSPRGLSLKPRGN